MKSADGSTHANLPSLVMGGGGGEIKAAALRTASPDSPDPDALAAIIGVRTGRMRGVTFGGEVIKQIPTCLTDTDDTDNYGDGDDGGDGVAASTDERSGHLSPNASSGSGNRSLKPKHQFVGREGPKCPLGQWGLVRACGTKCR